MIPMLVLISNVERMINGMNAYVEHHSIDPNLIQDTNYYNYFSITFHSMSWSCGREVVHSNVISNCRNEVCFFLTYSVDW